MPKIKTHKAIAKRYQKTGSKKKFKAIRRTSGQNHYNQKQRGKTERAKRRDLVTDASLKRVLTIALPNA